jgi:3-oxoacyl-[acyl-carrier protein] reductase
MMQAALITGASRGLGKALTLAFLNAGYHVAANYCSSEEEVLQIVSTRRESAIAVKADVGDSNEVNAMLETVQRTFGRLDVIICNAGITRDSMLVRQSEADWDLVLKTNLTGCFHIIRAAAPLMIKSGGGHIMNISSISGIKGSEGQAAYSASKAALIGLTITAARELAEYNIRINAVLPGYMLTDMGKNAGRAADKAKQDNILRKYSNPDEIAGWIVSFSGTTGITGQTFNLDSRLL